MKSRVFLTSLGVAGAAVLVGQMTGAPDGPRDFRPGAAFDEGGSQRGVDIYDVTPCRIGDLRQYGRIGTYPNGTVGMGISTTGQNVGNVMLPWYESPDVHHPVIAQNMYRVADGRMEQIGMSWLKHAWFAVQGTSCGSCQGGGNGDNLAPGCADTYGSGLNADQYWLGPRWEIRPNEHRWMDGFNWTGSHFARNSQAGDSSSHSSILHRLRVRMSDLANSNDTYYYEAIYYLLKDYGNNQWLPLDEEDQWMFNNARHDRVTPNDNGSGNFGFTEANRTVNGPLALQWGDMQSQAVGGSGDMGLAYVSSRAVDLGGGSWRYEYVVFNYSLDHEVRDLNIPVAGANITDVGFHAPRDGYYDNAGFVNESPYDFADWDNTKDGSTMVFRAPTTDGQALPNTIRYGTGYTFWFTADTAPSGQPAVGSIVTEEGGHVMTAQLVAPSDATGSAAGLTDVTRTLGLSVEGDANDLRVSDNQYYVLQSGPGFNPTEPHPARVDIGFDAAGFGPASVDVTVESHANIGGPTAVVLLKNWNTSDWDEIGRYGIGPVDASLTIPAIGASDYVNGASRIEVRVRTFAILILNPTVRGIFSQDFAGVQMH